VMRDADTSSDHHLLVTMVRPRLKSYTKATNTQTRYVRLLKRKTQLKEWISADTICKLETRKEKKAVLNMSQTRAAKAKTQEEYTAADTEVKKSTKKDKRDFIENLASEAEEAARQGNLKDLYLVTKKTGRQIPAY
jgi:DNA-directed RNA polymerase delta subunit